MNLEQLISLVNPQITSLIGQHIGLKKFAETRAKFEGWLKVELVRIFEEAGYRALPEVSGIDIVFESVAIELKTSNTNLRTQGVENKGKPITDNLKNILADVHKLRLRDNNADKYVIFIMFPIPPQHPNWLQYLSIINSVGVEAVTYDFTFANNVPAKIGYIKVQ
ncbi:MAG: hypothetical protein JNM41_04765 [Flavipsychrobacter sp.]|nr:hypothetical protein [Flavipsychrobacter sp.]